MGSFYGLSFAEEQKEEVKEITAVALTEILVVKCYPAQTMCSVAFYVSAEESLILLFCLSLFCCTSASQQNTSKEPHSHIMLLFFYSMTVVVILNKRSVFLFSRCSMQLQFHQCDSLSFCIYLLATTRSDHLLATDNLNADGAFSSQSIFPVFLSYLFLLF